MLAIAGASSLHVTRATVGLNSEAHTMLDQVFAGRAGLLDVSGG